MFATKPNRKHGETQFREDKTLCKHATRWRGMREILSTFCNCRRDVRMDAELLRHLRPVLSKDLQSLSKMCPNFRAKAWSLWPKLVSKDPNRLPLTIALFHHRHPNLNAEPSFSPLPRGKRKKKKQFSADFKILRCRGSWNGLVYRLLWFPFRLRPASLCVNKHLRKCLTAWCSRLRVGKSLCNGHQHTRSRRFSLRDRFFPLKKATGMLSSSSIECQSALQARRPSRLRFFSHWLTHQLCCSRCFQVHYWLMQIASNYEATSAERMMSKWWWSVNKSARTETSRNAR